MMDKTDYRTNGTAAQCFQIGSNVPPFSGVTCQAFPRNRISQRADPQSFNFLKKFCVTGRMIIVELIMIFVANTVYRAFKPYPRLEASV
jgi:hypothetical protein